MANVRIDLNFKGFPVNCRKPRNFLEIHFQKNIILDLDLTRQKNLKLQEL